MNKSILWSLVVLVAFSLTSCMPEELPLESTEPPVTVQTLPTQPEETDLPAPETTEPEPSETAPAEPETTEPEVSLWNVPGVSVDDMILYFNEVCLDGEIINSGDPSFVQKWDVPILYKLEGEYTDKDLAVIEEFTLWLNSVEGFPGMSRTEDPTVTNLRICFCTQEEIPVLMGEEFTNMDGAVTFWYADNRIYNAIICIRTDMDQYLRNSVILEEIYNGLGPIQDTTLRPDSIVYQEYAMPQQLTAVDEMILRLLYHPDVLPGMNAAQCAQVIRSLYE